MPTSHPLAGAPDPESLKTCPYNPSHVVATKRFQIHLVKCRKSYPNAKKLTCPNNTTHLINEQEYQFHMEVCYDRKVIDSFKYITPNAEACKVEAVPDPILPPNEENWDNEYSETYEPATKIAESTVTHTFIGGTKSERKKFRHEQRQRFRALSETNSDETKDALKSVKEAHLSDDQPLRRPTTRPKCVTSSLAQPDSQNQSLESEISGASKSASKPKKPSGVANASKNAMTKLTAAERLIRNGPGRSQNDDDSFVVFRSKGRGQFTQ